MNEERSPDPSAGSPTPLVIQAILRTDVGRVRSENQDFGILTTPEEEKQGHTGGRLFIVADGMGGHRGGATASRIAGETVKAQYLGIETEDVAAALQESLVRANAQIFSQAQSNADLRGMGTTTSALAVRGNEAWFAHVGDSRIYLIRGEEIRQLTDDHSLVASMVREGLLTAKEAETHPRRNVLQRSMGVAEDVEIDVRGPFEIQEGDTFILCSDGLHGLVKEPELQQVGKLPIEQAADEFLKRSLERGAPDNVTVIVARVSRQGGDAPPRTQLDETQPLTSHDGVLFDETQRDNSALSEAWRNAAAQAAPGVESSATAPQQAAAALPSPPSPPAAAPSPSTAGAADDTLRTVPAPETSVTSPAGAVTEPIFAPASPITAPEAAAVPAPSIAATLPGTTPAPAAIDPATPGTASLPPAASPFKRTPTLPGPVRRSTGANAPAVGSAGPPPLPVPPEKGSGSFFRWALMILILIVATGAWFYWSR